MIKHLNLTWLMPDSSTSLVTIKLLEPLEINAYVIEEGFTSDGGTIPLLLRGIFNSKGQGLPAFIAHDHRLVKGMLRKQANLALRRDLISCGVNKNRARLLFAGTEAWRILRRIK